MRTSVLFAVCSLSFVAVSQDTRTVVAAYPYLLHLETMNFDEQTCLLLQDDGKFHLEEGKGRRTRVFEGTLSQAKLSDVKNLVNNAELRELKQQQIHPPVGGIILDELHVDVFREDHWQDLFFPDMTTRRPFEHAITPLVRWLGGLRKEPHREVSEEEGKNDCQLPKRIALELRKQGSGDASPRR